MKSKLDHLEAHLQAFIEGSLSSLIPWASTNQSLAHQLVEAMQQGMVTLDGVPHAPNIYTILVHPSRLPTWKANPAAVDELAQTLEQAGKEAGIPFSAAPVVRVAIDTALAVQEARVVTSTSPEEVSDTASYGTTTADMAGEAAPRAAYFIVNGLQIFQIRLPVTNIGRRHDNHLIVDDPRVSRSHAQLRLIKGSYVLFDLNSSGGTYVNSQRIERCALKPGDVVSLAGIPLVFGIDSISDAEAPDSQSGSIAAGYTSQFPVTRDDRTENPD